MQSRYGKNKQIFLYKPLVDRIFFQGFLFSFKEIAYLCNPK